MLQKKNADTPIYKVISQRTLNSLCLEARARHINCWDKDVSRFVNSEQMPDYHPLLSYMNTLPELGRHGPRDSAGTTHLYERFLGKQFPPLDAGCHCPVERTHGAVCQRRSSHAGEQRTRKMQIHFLRIADARFVERLLYGQLRTDRTGRMRAEAGFFGLINLDEYDRLLPPETSHLLKNN